LAVAPFAAKTLPYRPALGPEIILTQGGRTIFGGNIVTLHGHEAVIPLDGRKIGALVAQRLNEIQARDFAALHGARR
jgi:hypothetical protein